MVTKHLVILFTLIAVLSVATTHAQDTTAHFKYVVLHYDHNNNAAPDYQKFRANLEDGIKELLVKNKVPMLKYQKEAAEKNLKDCDTLVCTYAITYATGLMLNANITCTLIFTDCKKHDVLALSSRKMVGAVAGGDNYLKVFAKLITPDIMKRFKF